jgi:cytochrome bd-type quinol oxidase subunit 2
MINLILMILYKIYNNHSIHNLLIIMLFFMIIILLYFLFIYECMLKWMDLLLNTWKTKKVYYKK